MLQNLPIVLVSTYASNWDDEQFFINLLAKIPISNNHHIFIGGDCNLAQDTNLIGHPLSKAIYLIPLKQCWTTRLI